MSTTSEGLAVVIDVDGVGGLGIADVKRRGACRKLRGSLSDLIGRLWGWVPPSSRVTSQHINPTSLAAEAG